MAFSRRAAEIWRAFATDGVPGSGAHTLDKGQIRQWGLEVETDVLGLAARADVVEDDLAHASATVAAVDARLATLEGLGVSAGTLFATKAEIDADLAHPANTQGWVYADSTAANNGIYRKIGASGAGSWTRVMDPPASTNTLKTETIGTASPVATGTSASGTRYGWVTAATIAGVLEQVRFGSATAQTGAIEVCSVNGDGTLNLVSSTSITVVAGVNTIETDIAIAVGHVVVLHLPSGGLKFTSQSGLPNYFDVAGAITTNTAKTVASNIRLEFGMTVSGEVLGGVHALRDRMDAAETSLGAVGKAIPTGPSNVVATGTPARSGYTQVRTYPAPAAGYISRLYIGVQSAATIVVAAYTLNGDGTLTIGANRTVTLAAGLNSVPLDIPIAAGQYPGVQLVGTNAYFQLNSNPDGLVEWYVNGAVTTSTAKTIGSLHRLEMAFEFRTGLFGSVNHASAAALSPIDDADRTGVADATAAFTSARAANPSPHVPSGTYALTTFPYGGGGFWGPGIMKVNGVRAFIPRAPSSRSLLQSLRLALADQIATASPVILIGDSIAHWAYATTALDHWFNQFTRFANLGIAVDEPIMTALRSSSTYTPAFYGVTFSGTVTTGTRGPLGESAILAAGASMSFTAALEQVDVFYTQESGAGSLSFAYNGGSAYKTVSAAGTLELDKYSGPSLTGQTASGTYTITASGGPVEITGLIRLGVKVANSPARLLTLRAAHGGNTFASYGSAHVTSVLKQAGAFGGTRPLVLIALGVNDSFGTAPASIQANQAALIDLFQAGGVDRILGIPPIKPSSNASYTGGRTYEGALGPIVREYRTQGCPVIPVAGLDWGAEGLIPDAVHPVDAGNLRYGQIVVEALADLAA